MRDVLEEIWATARRNKLRTALTGFAVAWGIFMLIFLLGAGNGLINGMTNNNRSFMSNSMMVGGGMTSKAYKGLKEGRNIELTDRDMNTTSDRFSQHVETVGGEIQQGGITISNGENYVSSTVNGVYPNEDEINKLDMVAGRFINEIDNELRRKVLVISENQAKELEPKSPLSLVGKYVKVGNFAFQVIGINSSDNSGMSTDTYTAFNTLRTMYGRGDKTDNIVFSFHGLETEKDNEAFEKQYKSYINSNHRAAPDDDEAVWIWNRFTQAMQMAQGMSIIRTALWIVGIFTLDRKSVV